MKYIVIDDVMSNTELENPQILITPESLQEFISNYQQNKQDFDSVLNQRENAKIEDTIDGALNDNTDGNNDTPIYIAELDDDDIDIFEDVTVRMIAVEGVTEFTFIIPYGDGEVFSEPFTYDEIINMSQIADKE